MYAYIRLALNNEYEKMKIQIFILALNVVSVNIQLKLLLQFLSQLAIFGNFKHLALHYAQQNLWLAQLLDMFLIEHVWDMMG